MAYLDDVKATLEAMSALRLSVIEAGPSPSYSVHGHSYDWTEYLKYLDDSIQKLRKEIAQAEPFQFTSIGM